MTATRPIGAAVGDVTATRLGSAGRREPTVLDRIAERRAADIRGELGAVTLRDLRGAARAEGPASEPRDLSRALARPGLHLIAEVKRRSPSAGTLADADADLVARAVAYEAGGAAAVSVLVEPHWFGGSLDDLRAVRAAVSIPVLAKEFVVDERQLVVLRSAGADVVLLLAALHGARRLRALVRLARTLGLEPLVEAHDRRELDRALGTDARLIGINNRDLRTLAVDLSSAERLRAAVPDDRLLIAESGVREPFTLARWRAVGFDGALVGEALMAGASDPAAISARVRGFVAAGRARRAEEDPAAAARTPTVKICGVVDEVGLRAVMDCGADAVGLNLVPGTKRALEPQLARGLARLARTLPAPHGRPLLVGIVADLPAPQVAELADGIGLDVMQLSGRETPDDARAVGRAVWKVLHLPPDTGPDAGAAATAVDEVVAAARAFLSVPNVRSIVLDTADPHLRGGTGRRADVEMAREVARRIPVTLAGGLRAGNVAEALRTIAAVGVDVASGVEPERPPRPGRRPTKDPFRVALFTKRVRGARADRPHVAFAPQPVDPGLVDADARGRWGTAREFGGRYVPETLVAALVELERAYEPLRHDPAFWAEIDGLARDYVGRPTPIYRADRLAAAIAERSGRTPDAFRLYLKREDLSHTGAHKINNAIGQALLAVRLGKRRVIAETGAGQHGVATATACALLDLACVVYMGAEDVRRQAPNVLRMRALGAEVRPVHSGSATLKDAINEAMRDWVTNVATTHYVLGSAVGPHPYPTIVRDLQRVIGDEAGAQIRAVEGRLPDVAVACVGGGSNAVGLFARFIGEPTVRLVGVEAGGGGLSSGRHAAALAGGTPGVLHGSRSYLLQDADGQVQEAHSISAGLDYPGIGPQLAALFAAGRMEVLSATDTEAVEALGLVARCEGILPALEPSHAIAALPRLLSTDAERSLGDGSVVLVGLSGRGDKDLAAIAPEMADVEAGG